jgi:hypothetical protein
VPNSWTYFSIKKKTGLCHVLRVTQPRNQMSRGRTAQPEMGRRPRCGTNGVSRRATRFTRANLARPNLGSRNLRLPCDALICSRTTAGFVYTPVMWNSFLYIIAQNMPKCQVYIKNAKIALFYKELERASSCEPALADFTGYTPV